MDNAYAEKLIASINRLSEAVEDNANNVKALIVKQAAKIAFRRPKKNTTTKE